LTLPGINNYSGGTTINIGTFVIGHANAARLTSSLRAITHPSLLLRVASSLPINLGLKTRSHEAKKFFAIDQCEPGVHRAWWITKFTTPRIKIS